MVRFGGGTRRRGGTRRGVRRSMFGRRRMRLSRRIYNPQPTFTETLDLGNIVLTYDPATQGAYYGGILQVIPNNIPQMAQYANLYEQICIRRLKFIIIPNYNFESANGTAGSAPTPANSLVRLTYAVNDTSSLLPPTSELEVLQDNGCKIRNVNRPIMISCKPVANLGSAVNTGGFAPYNKKNQWITTNAAGLLVPHAGVSFWFQQDNAVTNPPVVANVYCKVTFSLKDPK